MPAISSTAFTYWHILFGLLLLRWQPLVMCSTLVFAPPPGNSIAIRAVALDGKLKYVCERDGGNWVLLQKKATLMDQANQTKIIGFYASTFKHTHTSSHVGTWTLINNAGDQAESGRLMSQVSGRQVAIIQNGKNKLPNFLAQASLHRYEGTARRVSYIAQNNATISSQIPSLHCAKSKSPSIVTFKAMYVFWSQDLLPPKVPNALSVPTKHQPVEAFFAQGVIKYIYDPKSQLWRQRKVLARLYDVPGGAQAGGFSYNSTLPFLATSSNSDDLACIMVHNPNGFEICGRQQVTPISVTQSSLPWSLLLVTSNNGNITRILGPFSFVQMVSTWGGLPPQGLRKTEIATPLRVWKSSFTAILWLYT